MKMNEKFVCLFCLHLWRSRVENQSERQCSRCRRRAATSLDRLERAILSIKAWIDSHRNLFPPSPIYFPPAFVSTIQLLADVNPALQDGLKVLRNVYQIAYEYKPQTESLEECIRRVRKEIREEKHMRDENEIPKQLRIKPQVHNARPHGLSSHQAPVFYLQSQWRFHELSPQSAMRQQCSAEKHYTSHSAKESECYETR